MRTSLFILIMACLIFSTNKVLAVNYSVSLIVEPENVGIVSGDGVYNAGENVSITAVPYAGSRFNYWSDTLGNIFSYQSEFVFTMPENDVSLIANFLPVTYPMGIIDDFEVGTGLWWEPWGSGSTIGIIFEDNDGNVVTYKAHETEIVNPWSGSTGSMKLAIEWDDEIDWEEPVGSNASHLVRQHLPIGNSNIPEKQFQSGQTLEVFIFGDNTESRFRFMARDGNNQLEGSPWITIDWTGWRRVIWDYNNDENVIGWITGNGSMDGENFFFDSFQITRDTLGTVLSNELYFDDLRFFDPFETYNLEINITNADESEIVTIQDYTYTAGQISFTLFKGEYEFSIERTGYITYSGNFTLNDDLVLEVTLEEEPDLYLLTLLVDPEETGFVSGEGEYEEDEIVNITASPNYGYYFINWTDANSNVISIEPDFNYTMPADDITLTANFASIPPVFITDFPWFEDFEGDIFPPEGWNNFNAEGQEREWVLSIVQNHTPSGSQSAFHNYHLSENQDGWLITPGIIIPENEEFELSFWSYNSFPSYYGKNSVLISTGSNNPDDNEFNEIWTTENVTTSWVETIINFDEFSGDTIFVAFRYEGENAHGWFLDDVSINEAEISPQYTLTLLSDPEDFGTLTGAGDYEEGTEVAITALSAPGSNFLVWNDEDGNVVSTDPDFTFVMPAEDVTLIAVFVPNHFDLTLIAEPVEGGTLTGEGSYIEGTSITLTAAPNTGYSFIKWTDEENVEISTSESYNFTMPAMDITLVAHFDLVESVSELREKWINVFPNPAEIHFKISASGIIDRIVIAEITGKVVYKRVVKNTEINIRSNFGSGIYILHIYTADGVFVRKLQIVD